MVNGMAQTVEAVIDENGKVRLLESVRLAKAQRALVTVLAESPVLIAMCDETAILSESALSTDWNRPEEDDAWLHLQPVL